MLIKQIEELLITVTLWSNQWVIIDHLRAELGLYAPKKKKLHFVPATKAGKTFLFHINQIDNLWAILCFTSSLMTQHHQTNRHGWLDKRVVCGKRAERFSEHKPKENPSIRFGARLCPTVLLFEASYAPLQIRGQQRVQGHVSGYRERIIPRG